MLLLLVFSMMLVVLVGYVRSGTVRRSVCWCMWCARYVRTYVRTYVRSAGSAGTYGGLLMLPVAGDGGTYVRM